MLSILLALLLLPLLLLLGLSACAETPDEPSDSSEESSGDDETEKALWKWHFDWEPSGNWDGLYIGEYNFSNNYKQFGSYVLKLPQTYYEEEKNGILYQIDFFQPIYPYYSVIQARVTVTNHTETAFVSSVNSPFLLYTKYDDAVRSTVSVYSEDSAYGLYGTEEERETELIERGESYVWECGIKFPRFPTGKPKNGRLCHMK